MNAANGGKCTACDEGFEAGEWIFHFHRNRKVIVVFHDECLMPYLKERFGSPVGLPVPCGCKLGDGEPIDQPVFMSNL
jgi:hypothetical protein